MDALLGVIRHGGNTALLQAVEMSILSTLAGIPLHLHTEGLRGTGKTTILRAARRVLPQIRRVHGCPYNCDPAAPHCPSHRSLPAGQVAALGAEWVPMPFLEISHSAKVGTVAGSIDLARLVEPAAAAAALLPGTLPQANRGIVFVDEINRLAETAPELADLLLDAMGTKPGRVQIEETGLPTVEMPLVVSVWAASNPDEDPGPLEEVRRQLSDRFDFVIPTARPSEAATVVQILDRIDQSLSARPVIDAALQDTFRGEVSARAMGLGSVAVPGWLRKQVAEIYARFGLESLRAVQALLWGARLAAGLSGRTAAGWADLAAVIPLALHHRVSGETMGRVLHHMRGLQSRGEPLMASAAGNSAHDLWPGGQSDSRLAGLALPGAAHTPRLGAASPAPPEAARPAPSGAGIGAATGLLATAAPARAPGPAWPASFWHRLHRRFFPGRQPSPVQSIGSAAHNQGLVHLADPAETAPAAPLGAARAILTLPAADLVRTEAELNGGDARWTGLPS